ncbi:hypothetical protein JI735_33055 [Paenibacillus sonchi]|uniref:Uncharacterized protein n=1 Tax=Paenibacillus sonchi TaxID=373687 RepID=A0A974PCB6_9BACL|nr:hypothetical protein [Paenibacillus sonchi]QQZ61156.1 hypothetical protein JI735_33055 [Paenibacillus sonchi]
MHDSIRLLGNLIEASPQEQIILQSLIEEYGFRTFWDRLEEEELSGDLKSKLQAVKKILNALELGPSPERSEFDGPRLP